MLPRERRLSHRTDFTEVVRGGRRAGRRLLTVHLSPAPGAPVAAGVLARAGLVVSKAVGGSVVRTRVSRRLRHLLRDRLPALPDGTRLVVRAAPASADADSAALGRDLDSALSSLLRPPRPRR